MSIDIMRLTPQQLETYIHLQSRVATQEAAAAKVRLLRRYYAGEHPVMLTERLSEMLGPLLDPNLPPFAHNLAKVVLDALRSRLSITGISTGADENEDDPIATAMWGWFEKSRMTAEQIRLYRRTLRDGLSYVMVDFDKANNRPRFTLHHVDAGEQEPGIMVHRDPEDANRVLFAARYWWTGIDPTRPGEAGRERKTVYLPGEIRKYIRGKSGQWEAIQDEGDTAWPLPWVDTTGAPLGIPVIEFSNPGGSEIWQILGLQNLANKFWLDLAMGMDMNGFPIPVVEYDTTRLGPSANTQSDADNQGADEIRVSPGRLLEVDDARVHRLEAANPVPMIAPIDRVEQAISGVTSTPIYYLRPIGGSEVPSGEALKQLESGLVGRAEERQVMWGPSWQDVFGLAYRVNQTFGTRLPTVPELTIKIAWKDANVRNEQVEVTVAEGHQRLGIPQDELWRKLGYTPEQIQQFKDTKTADTQAQVAAVAAAMRVQGIGGAQAQQPAQPAQNGAAV